MKYIEIGMEMHFTDNDENRIGYTYIVTENFIVCPDETRILDDFGDDRLTVVICTDDGT